MNLLKTALALSSIPAPSGFEQAAIDTIADIARAYASDMRRTSAGSLLVRRPGHGRRVMLITHADTVGFLTTFREDCGALRFGTLGPVNVHLAMGSPVVSTRGTRGVIAADDGAEPEKLAKTQLYLDASGAELSEAFAFDAPGYVADGILTAPALSAALSAAVLLDVMADAKTDADVTFVFTAQHMLGARDASAAAFTAAPEFAVTIDGIPARDVPGGDGTIALGGGVVVSHQAGLAVADPTLTDALVRAANDAVQHDFAGPLVSDLAAIQKTGVGIPTTAAGFAVRGTGSLQERAAVADAEALSRALQAFLASGILIQPL